MKKMKLTARAFELAARVYCLTGGGQERLYRLSDRLQRYGWGWDDLDWVYSDAQSWAAKVHAARHRRYRTERVRGLA